MGVVKLDIGILALDDDAALQTAKYIAKSAGIFSEFLGYSFISKLYASSLVCPANSEASTRFFPQKNPTAGGVMDVNRFFYGDAVMYIMPSNLKGEWMLEVIAYGVDNTGFGLSYSTHLANTKVSQAAFTLNIPAWPVVAVDIFLRAEGASSINVSADIIWNGLYITNG